MKSVSKRRLRWFIIAGVCLAVFAIYSPVLLAALFSNRAAYQDVLRRHNTPGPTRHGAARLLYVSWFPDGNPKFARDCTLYSDGLLMNGRVVWNRGATASGGWINKTPGFHALLSLPPLPNGLADAGAVSCGRLLIVSRQQGGVWVTRYYDREHLPAIVQQAVRLTGPAWRLRDPNPVFL